MTSQKKKNSKKSSISPKINTENQKMFLFQAACMNADEKEILSFLENGGDVNCTLSNGYTGLMLASFIGHDKIVSLLIEKGAKIDIETTDSIGETALMMATYTNHIGAVRLLLKGGADPEKYDKTGRNPFNCAESLDLNDILSILILYRGKKK
jgi:ankyrin repeat protein